MYACKESSEDSADDDDAELSLTVPITNSMAFLFTVLGDWYVDGKIISRSIYPSPSIVYILRAMEVWYG